MRKRYKKKLDDPIILTAAQLWMFTMFYAVLSILLGVISVVFLMFDAVSLGNFFVSCTKGVGYAFIITAIFSVIFTAICVVAEALKKEE